jgi:hypothetical protein
VAENIIAGITLTSCVLIVAKCQVVIQIFAGLAMM